VPISLTQVKNVRVMRGPRRRSVNLEILDLLYGTELQRAGTLKAPPPFSEE